MGISRVAEVLKELWSRGRSWALTGATVCLVGSCGHGQLVPAASAHMVPGAPTTAFDEQEGVRGASGRTYRPLPVVPLDHDGARAPRLLPIFADANFFVGPRYRDVYPSLESWSVALQRDETFYQRQYQLWGDGLPTPQMQRSALPEGVLGDGGEMSGYLYFENATHDESRLKLKAELDEGHGGDVVATIELPFRVE